MAGESLDELNAKGGGAADLFSVQNQAVQYLGLIYQALLDGPQRWVAVPALATSSGVAGQMAYESGFLYVCVASNTWQRATLSTF